MRQDKIEIMQNPALLRAAEYGQSYRSKINALHPSGSIQELRNRFCVELPDTPTPDLQVIDQLIEAAEPGLVGNTHPDFFAWVMGGSNIVGVAADWLTSVWGQNAGIFQTSPAAAIAEEAASQWILELLDLPRESSVGFVTGATMAGFVALAAARSEILARHGHNYERYGLQSAPFIRIFLSNDSHASNVAALRHLGFGEENFVRIKSDENGLIEIDSLENEMSRFNGPKIVISTAGHINSGGFEDFEALAKIAQEHRAWLHIDGAFGLWARVLKEKNHLTRGLELADSWSVDGHKWLQIPYDSGFAIVKDAIAHKRAMDITAGYLNHSEEDGRNPTEFNPELSRRARGFAVWAVLKSLGKEGVRELIARHCNSAQSLAAHISSISGLSVSTEIPLNQVTVSISDDFPIAANAIQLLADELNNEHSVFVKTASWKEKQVLRFSIISKDTNEKHVEKLANSISTAWNKVRGSHS